jgi:hypothetical protein
LRFVLVEVLRFALVEVLRFVLAEVLRFVLAEVLRFVLAEVSRFALAEVARFALAEVSRAPRWAGTCFHGSRASEPGLDGRIPRAFGQSSTCACVHRALGSVATRRDALDDPVRLRNKPPPTSPRRHLGW